MGVVRKILGSAPVRGVTHVIARIIHAGGRLASFCRARAIFPNAPDLVMHWSVDVKRPENICLGKGVVVGPGSSLGAAAPLTLGDNVRLSRDVILETAGLNFRAGPAPYKHLWKPIVIEADVWIGARAMVLGGVTIGRGAVVAAGAIVSRDVPPGSIVAGIPARVVGMIEGASAEG